MTIAVDTCDGLGDSARPETAVDLPPDVPALRRFYLYLSAGCNLHCRHCWITPTFINGKPVQGECIDFELLKAAVAEAKPMGLVAAKLTGGEPVLHPDYLRIVDFLTAQGLDITMETNATLIDQAMADHLREKTNLSHIAVSLDSPDPQQHDRFRGLRGAFDAAVRGFGHLVSAGFRPQIIMSVDRENADRIEALIALAIRLGAGSVKFNPVTPSGRGAEIHSKGQALNFDELLDLTHRIRGPLQDRYPIHLSSMVPPAMLTVKELLRSGGDGGCCNVRHILGILGTGEIALCGIGRNLTELCFGILGKNSLREVWITHPTLRRLRQDLAGPFPGVCGDCLHSGRCLTHCLAMNYEATGKLVNVSPLCAEAERRGQFPPTRRISWGRGQPGA
jgi:SynChlorMet cassette radical SAM/SPASM protein ScmF